MNDKERELTLDDLSANRFTGSLPSSFSGLSSLQSLNIDGNFITGSLGSSPPNARLALGYNCFVKSVVDGFPKSRLSPKNPQRGQDTFQRLEDDCRKNGVIPNDGSVSPPTNPGPGPGPNPNPNPTTNPNQNPTNNNPGANPTTNPGSLPTGVNPSSPSTTGIGSTGPNPTGPSNPSSLNPNEPPSEPGPEGPTPRNPTPSNRAPGSPPPTSPDTSSSGTTTLVIVVPVIAVIIAAISVAFLIIRFKRRNPSSTTRRSKPPGTASRAVHAGTSGHQTNLRPEKAPGGLFQNLNMRRQGARKDEEVERGTLFEPLGGRVADAVMEMNEEMDVAVAIAVVKKDEDEGEKGEKESEGRGMFVDMKIGEGSGRKETDGGLFGGAMVSTRTVNNSEQEQQQQESVGSHLPIPMDRPIDLDETIKQWGPEKTAASMRSVGVSEKIVQKLLGEFHLHYQLL
ncbi:hypothetical protein HDU97_008865 [Phlyctochytrium planicorne]|nr:hypothetical protein HDU97_008865 [Phlyctochytrium planicorne]